MYGMDRTIITYASPTLSCEKGVGAAFVYPSTSVIR